MDQEILCVGEVLWDALPMGLFLGGAPFNVASHLHTLGAPVRFASRVGADRLGHEVRRRMRHRGLSDELVQDDAQRPTGFVEVELDATGGPAYTIVEPAAWDAITRTEALQEQAAAARALVFGSLAQRHEPSRSTLQALWDAVPTCVFDVNLRPPFDDRAVVDASLEAANIVKLNDDELGTIARWFALPTDDAFAAVEALAERFACTAICVTRGGDGALLYEDGARYEHPGFAVTVRDAVGAGDAFLAALLVGLLGGHDRAETLVRACRLGAYVVTQVGAFPAYDDIETLPVHAKKPASTGADAR